MARQRRNEQASLNFDGLTDAVTNLTGTLILLVVLILGITTEAGTPLHALRPPGEDGHDGKPIGPLLQKIENLKLQIQQVDQHVRELERDLPRLRQQVEDLRKAAESTRPRLGQDAQVLQVNGRRSGGDGTAS